MLKQLTASEFMKPSRKFLAQAVPAEHGGFHAVWAGPGMMPDMVYAGDERHPGRPGPPAVFGTEREAEAEARRVLVNALNSRKRFTGKQYRHIKMTGPEVAVALAEAGIGPGEFAALWGTTQERVMTDWIDGAGQMGAPFALWWVLELLRSPQNLARAREIAKEHQTERGPATADSK